MERLAGLSEAELVGVDERFGFRFCPDHREFLSLGLPVGSGDRRRPNWRSPGDQEIDQPAWPTEGTVFSVYQTDVIDYGRNLAEVIGRTVAESSAAEPEHVPFWSVPAEGGDSGDL